VCKKKKKTMKMSAGVCKEELGEIHFLGTLSLGGRVQSKRGRAEKKKEKKILQVGRNDGV